nr:MAG TPA: hypothetical protein [Bacteriophage sp.]DAK79789.1 MAG TPA: hypothetical protein [Caudoviricetes sp.]
MHTEVGCDHSGIVQVLRHSDGARKGSGGLR